MKREVGLWIDHRRAVIVTISHTGAGIRRTESSLEKLVLFLGSSSQKHWGADQYDKGCANYLSNDYDDIVACIRDAESIQIFGPDSTKIELEKRLKYEKLGSRLVGVENVEKMTERQIEAKVWQHFLSPA